MRWPNLPQRHLRTGAGLGSGDLWGWAWASTPLSANSHIAHFLLCERHWLGWARCPSFSLCPPSVRMGLGVGFTGFSVILHHVGTCTSPMWGLGGRRLQDSSPSSWETSKNFPLKPELTFYPFNLFHSLPSHACSAQRWPASALLGITGDTTPLTPSRRGRPAHKKAKGAHFLPKHHRPRRYESVHPYGSEEAFFSTCLGGSRASV